MDEFEVVETLRTLSKYSSSGDDHIVKQKMNQQLMSHNQASSVSITEDYEAPQEWMS